MKTRLGKLVVTFLIGAVITSQAFAQTQAPENKYLENLTPDNTVVILVDYLSGLIPLAGSMDAAELKNNALGVMNTALTFDLPVLILGDEDETRGQFIPELAELFPDTQAIPRNTPSAWDMPAFREAVEATGRTKLVFAGITTDNCVTLTSLDAMRDGYDAYVVVDASGADSELAQEATIMRLVQAGATPMGWVQLGSELLTASSWETPEGAALGEVYATYIGSPATTIR